MLRSRTVSGPSKQYEKRHWSNRICVVLRRARYRVTQRQPVALGGRIGFVLMVVVVDRAARGNTHRL